MGVCAGRGEDRARCQIGHVPTSSYASSYAERIERRASQCGPLSLMSHGSEAAHVQGEGRARRAGGKYRTIRNHPRRDRRRSAIAPSRWTRLDTVTVHAARHAKRAIVVRLVTVATCKVYGIARRRIDRVARVAMYGIVRRVNYAKCTHDETGKMQF